MAERRAVNSARRSVRRVSMMRRWRHPQLHPETTHDATKYNRNSITIRYEIVYLRAIKADEGPVRLRQDLMSDGSEFQVRGDATENARRASSLRVLGTVSSGA